MPSVGDTLRQRRLVQAREAATLLYHAGARRVWLFGSLARGDVSDKCTDIDLAVEGLDAGRRRSLGLRLRAFLQCKVDVVGWEDAGPALRHAIEECRLCLPAPRDGAASFPSRVASTPAPLMPSPRPVGLHQQRLHAVLNVVQASGLSSVIDFGCGAGLLLERLAADPGFQRILGVDSSAEALAAVRRRLGLGRDSPAACGRIRLMHGLATNPDPRLIGYDVAVAMELIEHLDVPRLSAFTRVIFSYVQPSLFVVTTPNAEYNVRFGCKEGTGRRLPDHRFEWTRDQFRSWLTQAAGSAGYACSFADIGACHTHTGAPTQMAVCTRTFR